MPADDLARFVTRWWTPVFRFAFNMLANASQAAAVTEETMFVLLERPGSGPLRIRVFRSALQFVLLRRRWARHAAESCSAMRNAIQRLSDLDRAALLLCDVEMLTSDEAAAVMGVPAHEVRARAHRSRLLLTDVDASEEVLPQAS